MMTASIRDAEHVPVVRVGKAVRLVLGLLVSAGVCALCGTRSCLDVWPEF